MRCNWLVAVLCVTSWAQADDTLATLGTGGLVPLKSTQIRMAREDLEIGVHQVHVSYEFRNDSDKDIDAVVAFPLPTLNGPNLWHSPWELPTKTRPNFVDFSLTVEGKKVVPQIEVKAFHEEKDVTAILRANGMSALALIEDYNEFRKHWKELPPKNLNALSKQELMIDEGELTADNKTVPDYFPNWDVKVKFYWTQHFPAHGSVHISHTYTPVTGGGYMEDPDSRSLPEEYCGTQLDRAHVVNLFQKHPVKPDPSGETMLGDLREIQFILKTANNWHGPIGEFNLAIIPDHPDEVVATCMKGLKRVAPGRYELHRTQFAPAEDLTVAIVQARAVTP
jgi:hypothetical protein